MANIKWFEENRSPIRYTEGMKQLAAELTIFFYEYNDLERATSMLSSRIPALVGNIFQYKMERSATAPALYVYLLAPVSNEKEYSEMAKCGGDVCDAIIGLMTTSAEPENEA